MKTDWAIAGFIGTAIIIFGLVVALFMTWPKQMSNDAVVRETRKCHDANLRADRIVNGWTGETVSIQCIPKEEGR